MSSPELLEEENSLAARVRGFFEGAGTGLKAVANTWTGNLGSMLTVGYTDASQWGSL